MVELATAPKLPWAASAQTSLGPPGPEGIRLSPAQERSWLLEQLYSEHPIGHRSMALRLRGRLRLPALVVSLHEVLRRHEILRLSIRKGGGRPIAATGFLDLPDAPIEDLSLLPYAQRQARVRLLLHAEAEQRFDLACGPLWRGKLLRLAPEDHLWLVTLHPLAADPASLDHFCREWAALYRARHLDKPFLPQDRRGGYRAYADWQEQQERSGDLAGHLQYWRQKLGPKPPVLDLPLDRPRPPMRACRGAVKRFALPLSSSTRLKDLALRQGVSLERLLLTAYSILLYRWSGQEDLLVGWYRPGRDLPGTETAVGPFEALLALRTDLSGEPSFSTVLERVDHAAGEAVLHQALPFEKLLDAFSLSEDLSRSPLIQATFRMETAASAPLQLPDLLVEPKRLDNRSALFDLTLTLQESPAGITGSLEYDQDLFEPATIVRMLGHYTVLLEGVTANPDEPISRLPILTQAERRQLLVDWNDTRTACPSNKCVHQLFEEQVRRTPEAVAVVYAGQRITYAELNERAHRLALRLQQLGVGPDVRVGVCMARSLEMVVALYAIHKAGGAYVPMDPSYPAERLAFMLEDAEVPVLLTQKALAESLPRSQAKVVAVDTLAEPSTAAAPAQRLHAGVTPNNLAYMIYTSGSTGRPKGVMVRHRNAVNFFTGMDQAIGSEPGVWLAVTSISFDIHVLELFWTLTRGFKVILQADESASGQRMAARQKPETAQHNSTVAEQILQHGVTHLQCTPSLAGMMVNDPATREALRRVNKFFFGGEPLPSALVQQLADSGEIFNMYGPTETTVWSTVHPVTRQGGSICIGRPIANTEIYVLDRHLEPVPVGVPGELFIGGAGVVRGYLNRAELTAERFIPHPFSNDPDARLYRTGDLARYKADGTIEFLGRLDHQVKVRGFRIELGEIEAALRSHPAIKDSVVSVWEAGPNDKRLVGYFVAQAGPKPALVELRRFVRGRLPEYMVPSILMSLEELPLTPNGKVDRKALPAPEAAKLAAERTAALPPNALEQTIIEIWQEVLQVRPLDPQDNFYDLGGDWRSALEAHARLCGRLNLDLPVAKAFEFRTAGALAKHLQETCSERLCPNHPAERARRQQRSFQFV